MNNIKTNQTILKHIYTMLENRRRVFFTIHPDARKQQQVINAENHLWLIANPADQAFAERAKRYADTFINPLIPTQVSRYYTNYRKLVDNIHSLS